MANNKEYSLKMIDESRKISAEKLDYTPIEIPVSHNVPETFNNTIQKILYSSGMISQEAYHKMLGINYDGEGDGDFDDDDDEFDEVYEQSPHASYDEGRKSAEVVENTPVETPKGGETGNASPGSVDPEPVVDTQPPKNAEKKSSSNKT
ncbi:hypothetical protein [Tortoise microvirus 100]|nr:hypothetical protein [Tortoise microvirus 100]